MLPLFTLVTLVTPCFFFFPGYPLLPVVTRCYPLLLVSSCYSLLPLVTLVTPRGPFLPLLPIKVKILLEQRGLGEVWMKVHYVDIGIVNMIRQRRKDIELERWLSEINIGRFQKISIPYHGRL